MKKSACILLLLLFISSSYPSTKYEKQPTHSILICRPIDFGSNAESNPTIWMTALLDRLLRFRLEPLKEIDIVHSSDIKPIIPELNNYSTSINDGVFFSAAKKLNISNVLITRFEISQKTKTLQFFIEVQAIKDLKILAQEEMDIPFDSISSGIDLCLIRLVNRINPKMSEESIRFLNIPIISNNFKVAKQLGELFVNKELYPASELFKMYEKIIDKEPYMLLAYYAGGFVGIESKNYDKSAQYIKQLLDLTPIHTELFFPLAQSYRLAGQLNEALNTVIHCEKLQLKSVDLLFEKALIYEGMNQRGHALAIHQQVLSLNPQQPRSLLYLAKEKNNAAQFNEALDYAKKLIKVDPQNGYGHYELSRSLSALQQYKQAYEAINSAAALLPNDPAIQEWMGDLHVQNQRYSEATKSYHNALQSRPDDFQLYLKTSRAMSKDNHTLDALSLLRQIEKKFPNEPILKKEISILELSEGNTNIALPRLENYISTNPDDGEALLSLGKIYIKTADYDKAVSILNKALLTSADKIVCRLYLASAYLRKKDFNNAKQLLENVIAEKPLKDAHQMMAQVYLAQGDMRNALNHFKKERELHGESLKLQEHIALLHFNLGFFVPAKTEFAHILDFEPKHQYALYYLAILHLREGNIKSSEIYLKDAMTSGPGNEEIFYQLGTYYKNQSKFEKSIDAFNKCLAFNAANENALIGCSESHSKLGNDSTVAEIYTQLFNINNDKYYEHFALAGHLFLKKELSTRAERVYSYFLQKGYTDFSVNSSYASIAYEKKDYAKVIDLLQHAEGTWKQNQNIASMLADSYHATGKYSSALPWCNIILKKNQNDRLAIRLAAWSFEMTGDTISALSMYERYLKLPIDEFRSEFMFHSGKLYELRGLKSNAIARYENALKEFPDELRIHESLSTLYIQNKNFSDARRVLMPAVINPLVPAKLQKMLAQTNVALNLIDDAEILYKKYLERVENDAEAWKDLGKLYFDRDQYTQATIPLEKAIALLPTDFDCLRMLGASYVKLKNYSKAIAPLGRARAISKNNTEIIELSAHCYRNLNETSSLTALLREWMAIDPKRFDTKMELGRILLEEKKVSEAISMFEDAVRFIPTEASPYLFLAKAYEIQGNDSIRMFHLQSALKYSQPNWEIHYQMARYYISKDMQTQAVSELLKSIDLNPSHGLSHFEYGNILLKRNDYQKALVEYQTALASEPNNPLYLVKVAFALSKTGNIDGSLEYCTVALGKSSTDLRIVYWAGMTYRECGRKESAYQLFNDALRIDPSSAIVYEALGDLYISDFNYSEASKHYFKSWENGGFNENRAFKLGTSLLYDRKFIESRDFFEAILTSNPSNEIALYKVIENSSEIGDLKKARQMLSQFRSNGTPWMQLGQGKIYEAENNPDAALTAYTIARRISPDHPYVYTGLGRVYLQKEMYDSAINYFSNATLADSLDMQSVLNLGVAFEKIGDLSSAYLYLSEVDKRYPLHPDVHAMMARIQFKQKDYSSAVKTLERGLKYHPEDTNLYLLLGNAFENQNLYEKAVDSYQMSLKKGNGKPIEAFRHIGNIYFENLVNNKKAKEYYKRYVKAGGKNQDVSDLIQKLN